VATARPGWSRRAQYSLFFSFLALIAGILVGAFLLALSLLAPARFEAVRGAALDITGPISSSLHEVTATAAGLVTGAGDYWDAAGQNGKLKREGAAMRRQILPEQAQAIRKRREQPIDVVLERDLALDVAVRQDATGLADVHDLDVLVVHGCASVEQWPCHGRFAVRRPGPAPSLLSRTRR